MERWNYPDAARARYLRQAGQLIGFMPGVDIQRASAETTLTGIPFHIEFAASGEKPYLQPLADLLHGVRRTADAPDRWEDIASQASTALRGSRCRVETAHVSPDKRHLAICSEVRTMLGFRVHQAGMLYSLEDAAIVGRIAMGKRTAKGWIGSAG